MDRCRGIEINIIHAGWIKAKIAMARLPKYSGHKESIYSYISG